MYQYDLDFQMTLTFNIVLLHIYHFALTFWISVITLLLVNGFTSYSHTMLLLGKYLFINMSHHDLDLQMTLIFNIL